MKPTADPNTPATEAKPPISLVPPPTEAEQLAKALAEVESLKALHEQNAKINGALLEKLRLLERNPFNFALSNIDSGAVLEEAGDEIKTLCAAVHRLQDKGTFTLKITAEPFNDKLLLKGDVKIAAPKAKAAKSIFWATEDGYLQRNDPKQDEFRFSRGDRSPGGSDDEAYAEERAHPETR